MINKRLILILTIVCGHNALSYGSQDFPLVRRYPAFLEKWLDSKSHSRAVLDYSEPYIREPKKVTSDSQFTDLFKKAQREIGIPEENLLEITDDSQLGSPKINQTSGDEIVGFACTTNSEIKVNPERFAELSYGAQRHTALHEAFHHKENDLHVDYWMMTKLGSNVMMSTTAATALCLYKMFRKTTGYKKVLALSVGIPLISLATGVLAIGTIGLFTHEGKYKEFKTDRNAVESLKCHQCVEEASNYLSQEKTPYFSESDFKIYRDYYKQRGLLCDHHKK